MATVKLEINNIDITQLIVNQKFGFKTTYFKRVNLKHRRTKINNINYNTAKSDLIWYESFDNHDNDFYYEFIYKTKEGLFFKRIFNPMEEIILPVKESYVILKYNNNKSLF